MPDTTTAGTPRPEVPPLRPDFRDLPDWAMYVHYDCATCDDTALFGCWQCRNWLTTDPVAFARIREIIVAHQERQRRYRVETVAWEAAQPRERCMRCLRNVLAVDTRTFDHAGQTWIICTPCWGAVDTCDFCNESALDVRHSQHLVGGSYICNACASGTDAWGQRAYATCEACDGIYRREDAENGDIDLCRVYGGTVHYYSYKPVPLFHYLRGERDGTDRTFVKGVDRTPYLGFELEVNFNGEREVAVEAACEALGDLAYLKEDGSLDNGFEIVTHPMTYAYAVDNFPWSLLPELENDLDGADGYTAEDTGLHVHVSKRAFDNPAHEYRWLLFWHRNTRPMLKIARRVSDEWASFTREDRKNAKRIATKKIERYEQGRYRAINTLPEDTYEVRIFRSSLNPAQVKAALALVSASVEYTRELDAHGVLTAKGWEFAAFAAWVKARPLYQALTDEIDRLRLLDPVPSRKRTTRPVEPVHFQRMVGNDGTLITIRTSDEENF